MNLTAPFQNVDPFLGSENGVAVKVRTPLLEFREIFDGLQGPLRSEEPLNVDPAQCGCVESVTNFLRPNVSGQMCTGIGVSVDVTVEAAHTTARAHRSTVVGLVKLLLHEG